jgi:predicted RNA binding protein YcfA (HicA-like mRNA interferase family)
MTKLAPVSRRELIHRLRKLGFAGPYSGGNHEFMLRDDDNLRLILPNPHRRDIGVALLSRLLRQAAISRQEWESAKKG